MKIYAQEASLLILICVVTFFISYALMPDDVELHLEFKKVGLHNSPPSSTLATNSDQFAENLDSPTQSAETYISDLQSPTSQQAATQSSDQQSPNSQSPTQQSNQFSTDYAAQTFMPDQRRQRILFIGDSMLEGLSLRLNDYAAQDNNYLMTVIWYASGTRHWGGTDSLSMLIQKYKPTYIFISCGGNELVSRNVEGLKPYIRNIVQTCGDIPFVWIGPPNWKQDTGINDAIRSIVGNDRFFDSSNLHLARQSDHIHPTYKAAAQWMDSIATWVSSDQTAHPIQMTHPTVKAQKRNIKVFKRAK